MGQTFWTKKLNGSLNIQSCTPHTHTCMYTCIYAYVCTLYVCIYMSCVYTHAVWFIIFTLFNIRWGIITDINKDLAKIFITGKYWKQGTHQPIGDLLKKFWFRGILFSHLKPMQKNTLPSLLPTHWDARTLSSMSGLPQQWLGEPSVQRAMAESTKGSPVCLVEAPRWFWCPARLKIAYVKIYCWYKKMCRVYWLKDAYDVISILENIYMQGKKYGRTCSKILTTFLYMVGLWIIILLFWLSEFPVFNNECILIA